MANAPVFDETKLPPYTRNRPSFPKSVDENIAWLRQWQKQIICDSFDFDYHYMWDHFNDPGYYRMADILLQDIKGLRNIGLNGLVSCQVQRSCFPTGLGMYLMAEGLWNREIDFESSVAEYFLAAFGPDGLAVRDYLRELSDAFDPRYLRRESGPATQADLDRLSAIVPRIDSFLPTIRQHAECAVLSASVRQSWRYLLLHVD